MYKQFVQNLVINSNKIQLIRFDSLSVPCQDVCRQHCRSRIFVDEYTIWHIEEEGLIHFLGFVKCEPKSVFYSKFYKTKVFNSWQLGGEEPQQMAQQKAYQIAEWEIDNVLRNKNLLVDLFTKLALELCDVQNLVLLWKDGSDDLICYPISTDYKKTRTAALGAFFADHFITL